MSVWASRLAVFSILVTTYPLASAIAQSKDGETNHANSKPKRNQDDSLPVSVKCPAENAGTLEVISKTLDGMTEKLLIRYIDDQAMSFSLGISVGDEGFLQGLAADIAKDNTKQTRSSIDKVNRFYRTKFKDACFGTKIEKSKFEKIIENNRIKTGHKP